MRTPTTVEWQHVATYEIDTVTDIAIEVNDQLLDKDGEHVKGVITRVEVTWYDPSGLEEGDDHEPLIRFYAKPLTSKGTIDRRVKEQPVFFPGTKDYILCAELKIDVQCPVGPRRTP